MINQNIYDEISFGTYLSSITICAEGLEIYITYVYISLDYRYYEDPSDEFRDEEGTLLPLWKFQYDKTKKLNVTDMCFNTFYYDLFIICFGSCE